jgi:NAD(P)-dependent dehydrogenase (short-subunit alcohol dehydrogenase family)
MAELRHPRKMIMEQNMRGTICVVTGASSGIGKEVSRDLASLGAAVVMVCRNRGLGEDVRTEIMRASGNENVHLMLCDLSSQTQIRALASEYASRFDKLDVLVNNAAIIPTHRSDTEDGIEQQLAVNHIAYFLLSDLLLGLLKTSAPARIINVSSGMHRTAKLDFDDLQARKRYRPLKQYAVTKLLNVLWTYELSRRLEGTGVTVNAMSPGFTSTRIFRDFPVLSRTMARLLGKNVRRGAETVTYMASSPDVVEVTGRYFENCRPRPTGRLTHDSRSAALIWEETEKLICSKE